MRKFSASVLSAVGVLTLASMLGGCAKTPTGPSTQSGGDLSKAAAPSATPSPISSPTASPSPSPDPAIPFDVFFIKEARAEWQRDPGDQRFEVEGLFVLAGTKLPDSAVAIVFGNFRVVIPGGSFVRNDDNDGFKLKREQVSFKEVELNDNGTFEIEGRDLNLTRINFNEPVLFALQIGNARGEFRIPFDNDGRFENPNPLPSPSPSPTMSPSPLPWPTTSPSPLPSPTTSPSPLPSPTTSPSPLPSPTTSPSPLPSPTTSPSPLPSPTTSPSPLPSPTTSPSPLPSPTTSPSPLPSPELHLEGAIQALVVRTANSGEVTVQGVKFTVTNTTRLEDENGDSITLNAFAIGQVVGAWGPPAVNGATQATKIRKE